MSTTAITTVMAEQHVYRRLYLLISLGVVLFDRLTKYLITANLALHDSGWLISSIFTWATPIGRPSTSPTALSSSARCCWWGRSYSAKLKRDSEPRAAVLHDHGVR